MPRKSKRTDGLGVYFVGNLGREVADGVRQKTAFGLLGLALLAAAEDGPLCGLRNARHGLYYLHGIKAHRSFGAEHYRIGSVHHRIGHVVHLGTRGRQAFNHGFHHLRSHDYGFAKLNGLAHNHFLN